jgi:hypothetical protein
MKTLLTLTLLTISYFSNGQFEGKWYTFRIEDIAYNTLTKDKLIVGRIGNYDTPKEYLARTDTFSIEYQFLKNDSTLYIITNRQPDDLKFELQELQIHKFVYHKTNNTITSFFYDTMKDFYDFQLKTKKLQKKDIQKFINGDTSKLGYVTYYKKDAIDTFLAYPKLIDQSSDKIVKLYNNLTSIYKAFSLKTDKEKLPYALLKGMSKSVLQVPIFIDLKICPLVKAENFDEIEIREKFSTNKEVIGALNKFRASL